MAKIKKCPKCDVKIEGHELHCPECGVNIQEYKELNPPEPKLKTWEIVAIVLCLIFVLPIGIIVLIIKAWELSQRKKAWRAERLINATRIGN